MSKKINWFKKVLLWVQQKTGVKWINVVVYAIALFISIGLICLFFCNYWSDDWRTLFVSLGASGVASVFLAFFIEMSNGKVHSTRKMAMRHNKLISVVKQTEISIQETIRFYFEFIEDVLGYVDNRCHIITYPQLILELENLSEQLPQLLEKSESKEYVTEKFEKLTKTINRWMQGIANKIGNIEHSLSQYEAQGYFTTSEVSSLLHAKKLLDSLNNSDILDVKKYSGAINKLLTLPEFSYLKDTVFYCKYCCVAIKEYFLLAGFSETDINEIVGHNERISNLGSPNLTKIIDRETSV